MTVNATRLSALLEWAEAEHEKKLAGKPSEWDQSHWAIRLPNGTPINASCATACCLAGKTVAIDGGKFLLRDDRYSPAAAQIADYAEMPDGRTVEVSDYARDSLGLTDVQSGALFEGENTIEDVRRIVEAILDGDPEPLGHEDHYYAEHGEYSDTY